MYSGAAWSPLVRGGSGSGLDADTLDGYHLGGLSALGSIQPYVPLVKTDGVMEVGRYLDFHAINEDDQDHTARLSANPSNPGELYIQSNKIWHEGNFNPANYLPLTGGTLTGGLTVPSIEATEAPSSFGTQRLARAAQMIGSTNLDFILFQPWLGVIGFFWNAPSAPCAYGFVELKLYYSGANFAPDGNGPTEVYIQEVTSWDGLKKWRRSIRMDSVNSFWDPWYEVGASSIEGGTESTGHYVKFPNGMMQIWRTQTIDVSSWTWTATGSLYRATITLDDFPFTFTGRPTVHKTISMCGGVHMWGGGCTVEPTSTKPGNYIVWSYTTTPPTDLKIAYTATGWWK